jgi:hypothetical protein
MSGIAYLLWSINHNAYWRPNSAGYTHNVDEAGRYSEAEATRKVIASAQCGIRTQVTCMVAAPDNWAPAVAT